MPLSKAKDLRKGDVLKQGTVLEIFSPNPEMYSTIDSDGESILVYVLFLEGRKWEPFIKDELVEVQLINNPKLKE